MVDFRTEEKIKKRIELLEKAVKEMEEKPIQRGDYRTSKCFVCNKKASEILHRLEVEDNLKGQLIALKWVIGDYDFYGGREEHD
jgi:hypothetical protein